MESLAQNAIGVAWSVLPIGAAFVLLAAITKRRKLLAAWRRCRREGMTNVLLLAFNALLFVPIFMVPVLGFHGLIGSHPALAAFWERLPEIFVLLAAIFLIDFAAYWRHRLEHEPGIWRFHATHHADTAIHWLTVQRKHPVGKLLSMLADHLPVLLLGFPLWAIAGAALLRSLWGYFIHADVPWTLGIFGKVLISPAAHRLHHIRDEELMGSNYGNTVTLWDHVFRTWRDPAPYLDCETGIAEGTRGFLGELARPWERRYRDRDAAESEPAEAAA